MIEPKKRKINSLLQGDNRTVIINVVAAFAIKGLALGISFFTMPSYMRFFHNEAALGLWFTVLSILTWILNFDLGIGNGLRNHLTTAIAKHDHDEIKKYLSSAYYSVGAICLLTTVLFVFAFDYINWNQVFNIDTHIVSPEALILSIKIVFVSIEMQLFLKLISSVLYAVQKSSLNNFISLVTSCITLCLVNLLPSKTNDDNIICMAIIHAIAVLLPLLITTILVFGGNQFRSYRPKLNGFSKEHARKVLSLGGSFFFVQIAYMLIMNTNDYLITLLSGNESVVEYQIYNRVFTLAGTVFALAMTPIWSVVTKAAAENNIDWIRKLYKLLMKLAILGAICEFVMIPFLQIFVNIWLKESAIIINPFCAITFAVFGGLMILSGALSSIANGLGELRTQSFCFTIGALLKVPLSIILVRLFNSWTGTVVANIISIGIYCIAQPIVLSRCLKQVK